MLLIFLVLIFCVQGDIIQIEFEYPDEKCQIDFLHQMSQPLQLAKPANMTSEGIQFFNP